MKYADGYVIPVPKKNLAAYRKLAGACGKIWREHGALDYKECAAEDLKCPFGVPFHKLAKVKRGETVVFSWVVYKSRKHRDAVNAKVLNDPRIIKMMSGMKKKSPFDVKRMTYGGFDVIADAR